MSVFVITAEDKERICSAADRARSHPIPLDQIERAATGGERPLDMQEPEIVPLPLGWRLNISCEIQPPGPLLHLSMSSPMPGKTIPRAEVVAMVLDALGYAADITPTRIWVEDFKIDGQPGGQALNILVPSTPPFCGHA